MSSIVLSASVRQNLLSLQSTASLLATTQSDLSTGNKVNSALDNPTSYFTASALNDRASDISNLLDGIGNGVQVLQAANTGITSLQSLIASAQSTANQVLQTAIGYSTKSSVSATAITGATANNLLGTASGTSPASNAVATGTGAPPSIDLTGNTNAVITGSTSLTAGVDLTGTPAANATTTSSATFATGLDLTADTPATAGSFTGTTAVTTLDLTGTPATHAVATSTVDLSGGLANTGDLNFTVNGVAVTVPTADGTGTGGNYTLQNIEDAINNTSGITVTASDDGAGHLVLTSDATGAGATIDTTSIDPDFGITSADVVNGQAANDPGLSFTINGKPVSLAGGASYTQQQIVDTINNTVGIGVTASFNSASDLVLTSNTTGTTSDFAVSGLGATFGIADGTSTNGANAVANPGLSFTINGQAVSFAGGSSYTQQQIEDKINNTAGIGVTASFDSSNHLVLTSTSATKGTGDTFTVSGSGAAQLGFAGANATATGTANVPAADLDFTVNGTAVTLTGGQSYTAQQVADKINTTVSGVKASIDTTTGDLVIQSTSATKGTADTVTVGGAGAATLGFAAGNQDATGTAGTLPPDLTFQVNGQKVDLAAGQSYDAADIAAQINAQVTGVDATVDTTTGDLVLTSTGTAGASDQVKISDFSSGDATQFGFASPIETANGAAATESIAGQTLTIASTGGGTATNITFGTGAGQISTLNDLNTALAANNLQATIDSTGVLTITTTNNAASSTIGAIGGTATIATPANGTTPAIAGAFANATAGGLPPVVDPNAQATRTGLINQYNNILAQIDTTAQDSSFNGINLLEGDTLNLTFDETGKSTLGIKGVTFNTAGLGLSTLTAGTDFLDSNSANAVLASLTQVSTTLRSEASNLGSNLSIVQIRQDFSKNMINVLQTGASNLTLADTNEEAANSQALSTRQSIAVSALALANQSQQSVLQLLR